MTRYADLLATLDAWFSRGREAAGADVIPCRRACTACCHGVFDISPADAELVAAGVAALPEDQAAALRARAQQQSLRVGAALPEWGAPWDVDALPEATFDALSEQLADAACPALAEDGGCTIYDSRPATCRMTGLSMDGGAVGRLDNECPIQADHPTYAALAPVPFDLMAFEEQAAGHDETARSRGHCTTTVAGAIAK